MSQVPVELIVAAFHGEQDADHVLEILEAANQEHVIGIQNAAVICRDASNKLYIRETAVWSGDSPAIAGALIGGAIGILFPPKILVSGSLAATIACLSAKLGDSGFPGARIGELGASLTPGTSAIIAVVEQQWAADVERQLAEHGAKIVCEPVAADVAAHLDPQPARQDPVAQ